jgi:glycosyltransferase involved in cell wall biosynthesis
MTPRLLFHYPVLNQGGAEMSSLRMMQALADRGWQITLVLTSGGGKLEERVDPRIRVVTLRPWQFGRRFFGAKRLGERASALPDLMGYLLMWVIGGLRMIPFAFRSYDAAAVLLMGTPSLFIRKFVRARVRAIWIRNDLAEADPSGRVARMLQAAVPEIDYFICVSDVARRSLIKVVPAARGKDVVSYNILDPDTMRARAQETPSPLPPSDGRTLRVLTVCRLQERAKGLLRMATVCRALKDHNYDFHWYVAGDGPDRLILEAEIRRLQIADRMTLLGRLDNPFPAYAACDLVAVLSKYEGLCGVVNEAKVLGKAVIATEFSGIHEQIQHEVNGLIVDNDQAAIIAGMKALLDDAALLRKLSNPIYPHELLEDSHKLEKLERIFRKSTLLQPIALD